MTTPREFLRGAALCAIAFALAINLPAAPAKSNPQFIASASALALSDV